jgi:hypothetical protein
MTDTSGPSGTEEPRVPEQPENPPTRPDLPAQPEPPRPDPRFAAPDQWTQAPPPPPAYPSPPQNRQWHPHGLGKPGVIPLRPLNLGDILDGAITTIRRFPLLILGVSAIVAVVNYGLGFLGGYLFASDIGPISTTPAQTPEELQRQLSQLVGPLLTTLLVSLVITLLTQTFLSGFLTVVGGKAVLGKPVTFRDAITELKSRFLPLLGMTVLFTLAVAVATLLCVIPAIPVYVFLSLAGPALILERGRVGQAFSRSRLLVSGSFWRVLGILLLTLLIGTVIRGVFGFVFGGGTSFVSQLFNPGEPVTMSTFGLILQGVGTVIGETIVTPFMALVTVLLYIDQRMRKEGMDIELARAAGVVPPQTW